MRRWEATNSAAYEGAQLREGLFDETNTASTVWADMAYCSQANEAFLKKNGFVSRIHRNSMQIHKRRLSDRLRRGSHCCPPLPPA